MACNKEDVSKVKLGKLSPFTVNFLRDMRDFLGVTFKLKPNDEDGTVDAACIGTGYTNTAKLAPLPPPLAYCTPCRTVRWHPPPPNEGQFQLFVWPRVAPFTLAQLNDAVFVFLTTQKMG